MEGALEWLLKLVQWQFFATLTWSDENMGGFRRRSQDVSMWLRRWAAREERALNSIAWVTRWERGELGDRPHAHLLLTGFPAKSVHMSRCVRQSRIWHTHYGLAQVRLFDPSLRTEASSYFTKGDGWQYGGNQYEVKKFDRADSVFISRGAWNAIRNKRGIGHLPNAVAENVAAEH